MITLMLMGGLAWADCSARKPEVCRAQGRSALRRIQAACDGGAPSACAALGSDDPNATPPTLSIEWTPSAIVLRGGGADATLSHVGGALDEAGLQQALQDFQARNPDQSAAILILPPDATMRDVTPMLSASARIIEPILPLVLVARAPQ